MKGLLHMPSVQKFQKQAQCSWIKMTQHSKFILLRFSSCSVFDLSRLCSLMTGKRIFYLKVIPMYMILRKNTNLPQLCCIERVHREKNYVDSVWMPYPQHICKCNPSDKLCNKSQQEFLSICPPVSPSWCQFPTFQVWAIPHSNLHVNPTTQRGEETQVSLLSHSSSGISPASSMQILVHRDI